MKRKKEIKLFLKQATSEERHEIIAVNKKLKRLKHINKW